MSETFLDVLKVCKNKLDMVRMEKSWEKIFRYCFILVLRESRDFTLKISIELIVDAESPLSWSFKLLQLEAL